MKVEPLICAPCAYDEAMMEYFEIPLPGPDAWPVTREYDPPPLALDASG